jgi:hypothetical protein
MSVFFCAEMLCVRRSLAMNRSPVHKIPTNVYWIQSFKINSEKQMTDNHDHDNNDIIQSSY